MLSSHMLQTPATELQAETLRATSTSAYMNLRQQAEFYANADNFYHNKWAGNLLWYSLPALAHYSGW